MNDQSAMMLTDDEWARLANICRFYLRKAQGPLPDQDELCARIIEAQRAWLPTKTEGEGLGWDNGRCSDKHQDCGGTFDPDKGCVCV